MGARLAACALLLAVLASLHAASIASAALPPGVDTLVSASAPGRTSTILSPRLRTKNSHTLILAFVIAGGAASERVDRVSGDGLRWSPIARSDGRVGAIEVWQARARRRLSGRIVARLASAAHPASIMVVAYGGTSPYVSAHAAKRGLDSTPKIELEPTAGSLDWTLGLSEGQRRPSFATGAGGGRVMTRSLERRRRTGTWVALTSLPTAHVAGATGASWSRRWNMVSVDVVVPSLKRLIEEGLLTAYGATGRSATGASALPPNCPPPPSFEVGVEDDPVFLGQQPAMTPARGFELASSAFHARLLRLNVIWGEVKRYGWAPIDRAVQMARERCWTVHMTIMWTPQYAEGYLPSELSAVNTNTELLAAFATEVARRYAGEVRRFAIGDEPDYPTFLARGNSLASQMASYDRLYLAGYKAVKAADPGVEVITGEVGLLNVWEWLHNVDALPSDGVGIHPYFLTNKTSEFVKYVAPVPLLVSEDGVQASNPRQMAVDLEREELARQAGVKEYVFYQLSRADSNNGFWWDTGIE